MEFKFRAVDDRRPPPFFNSSAQPFADEHFPPSTNFTRPTLPNRSYGSPFGDFMHYPGPTRPVNIRGLHTMLDFGRSRVREEIILSEIARRRELEMDVRRDIMLLEREIGMRREATSEGLLRWGGAQNGSPRLPMLGSLDERITLSSRSASTAFGALPLAQPLDNIAFKLNTSSVTDKDKLIVLAKPNPMDFGAKRKATTTPALDNNEEHPFGLKKKPKEEWSCALCHVTAPSEKGLNQHLQGRKHKVKEAGLLSQKIGKSSINVPSKKKTGNPSKRAETRSALKVKAEVEEKPPGVGHNKTAEDLESSMELPIPGDENCGKLNMVQTDEKAVKRKRTDKFWCEICKVGCSSLKVMKDHKGGKKHKNKFKNQANQSPVAPPTSGNLSKEMPEVVNVDIQSNEVPEVPTVEKQVNEKEKPNTNEEINLENQANEVDDYDSDAIPVGSKLIG